MNATRIFVTAVLLLWSDAGGSRQAANLPSEHRSVSKPFYIPNSTGQEPGTETKNRDDRVLPVAADGDSGRPNRTWRAPVFLGDKDLSRPLPAPSAGSIARELFVKLFPAIAGGIALLIGAMAYRAWRQSKQRNSRAASYDVIVERDWESRESLRKTLEHMEELHEQARHWTAEQLKTFRENDTSINRYDYDRLWDIWKRYEIRSFQPELHALTGSRWNEAEIVELLTFYVHEMKARWEILREEKSRVVDRADS